MKSINKNAPVQCSRTIIINASAENIWYILTGINDWSKWQNEIRSPALKGQLLPGSTFDWKTGGANIHSKIHTVEPFRQFGWTGKTFGLLAIHNWTLKELDGKTEVIVDESMEGLMASLFKKFFNKTLAKSMQHWLDSLKKECEK